MQKSAASSEQLHYDLYIPEPQFDQFQSEGTSWVQTSLHSDSSGWLCSGPHRWSCPPSPLCVQLWCCHETDAFPQVIFPFKQWWLLLWWSQSWMGGSRQCGGFRNTCHPIDEWNKAEFTTWESTNCSPLGPYSWCTEFNLESGWGVMCRIKALSLWNSIS